MEMTQVVFSKVLKLAGNKFNLHFTEEELFEGWKRGVENVPQDNFYFERLEDFKNSTNLSLFIKKTHKKSPITLVNILSFDPTFKWEEEFKKKQKELFFRNEISLKDFYLISDKTKTALGNKFDLDKTFARDLLSKLDEIQYIPLMGRKKTNEIFELFESQGYSHSWVKKEE